MATMTVPSLLSRAPAICPHPSPQGSGSLDMGTSDSLSRGSIQLSTGSVALTAVWSSRPRSPRPSWAIQGMEA